MNDRFNGRDESGDGDPESERGLFKLVSKDSDPELEVVLPLRMQGMEKGVMRLLGDVDLTSLLL